MDSDLSTYVREQLFLTIILASKSQHLAKTLSQPSNEVIQRSLLSRQIWPEMKKRFVKRTNLTHNRVNKMMKKITKLKSSDVRSFFFFLFQQDNEKSVNSVQD